MHKCPICIAFRYLHLCAGQINAHCNDCESDNHERDYHARVANSLSVNVANANRSDGVEAEEEAVDEVPDAACLVQIEECATEGAVGEPMMFSSMLIGQRDRLHNAEIGEYRQLRRVVGEISALGHSVAHVEKTQFVHG